MVKVAVIIISTLTLSIECFADWKVGFDPQHPVVYKEGGEQIVLTRDGQVKGPGQIILKKEDAGPGHVTAPGVGLNTVKKPVPLSKSGPGHLTSPGVGLNPAHGPIITRKDVKPLAPGSTSVGPAYKDIKPLAPGYQNFDWNAVADLSDLILSDQTRLVVAGATSAYVLYQLSRLVSRAGNPAFALVPPQVMDEFVEAVSSPGETYLLPKHDSITISDIKEFYSFDEDKQKQVISDDPEFAKYLMEVVQSISDQQFEACAQNPACS